MEQAHRTPFVLLSFYETLLADRTDLYLFLARGSCRHWWVSRSVRIMERISSCRRTMREFIVSPAMQSGDHMLGVPGRTATQSFAARGFCTPSCFLVWGLLETLSYLLSSLTLPWCRLYVTCALQTLPGQYSWSSYPGCGVPIQASDINCSVLGLVRGMLLNY